MEGDGKVGESGMLCKVDTHTCGHVTHPAD